MNRWRKSNKKFPFWLCGKEPKASMRIPGIAQWLKDPASDAGIRCSLDLASLWLWRREAATAQTWPLAWELLQAVGVAVKKKKIVLKVTQQKGCHGKSSQNVWGHQATSSGHTKPWRLQRPGCYLWSVSEATTRLRRVHTHSHTLTRTCSQLASQGWAGAASQGKPWLRGSSKASLNFTGDGGQRRRK